jgi:hypothetical protein
MILSVCAHAITRCRLIPNRNTLISELYCARLFEHHARSRDRLGVEPLHAIGMDATHDRPSGFDRRPCPGAQIMRAAAGPPSSYAEYRWFSFCESRAGAAKRASIGTAQYSCTNIDIKIGLAARIRLYYANVFALPMV